jgi:hypothetical protein
MPGFHHLHEVGHGWFRHGVGVTGGSVEAEGEGGVEGYLVVAVVDVDGCEEDEDRRLRDTRLSRAVVPKVGGPRLRSS